MADLEFALDLMRRLPPANVEQNLYNLCDMVPDMMSDLLGSVDQPLKIAHDSKYRKDYLLCDYNRDGDSYRYVSASSELAKPITANIWCKELGASDLVLSRPT